MSDYKKSLNLPNTRFPMKANLIQREPEMLKHWDKIDAYTLMVQASGKQGRYVLHDGPPYANGHIHMGTALNKILKDIIVKSQNMQGYAAEYVPGWDCHGLPIELKVEHELGEKKKTLPAHVVRKECRKYASKFIDIQRKEFKRLGVFGTWQEPYMSMDPGYEAATAHALADVSAAGNLARSKKPIYWCCSCHTALAEAEVEYYDHKSPSIFVRFPLADTNLNKTFPEAKIENSYVVIWTTTPWTLPDNMAVCLHPEFQYCLLEHNNNFYLLAKDLAESCAKIFGFENYKIHGEVLGKDLEGLVAKHPFYERKSPIVLGEHVTLDAGTGCVHTAPGHGREDYEVGLKYKLEIYSPLDDAGRFLDSVQFFSGLTVFEANPKVIEKLEEVQNLLAKDEITHSYPHCWRCKEPVIFRATTQWFIGMDINDLRKRALDAIRNKVQWIPTWGEERIYNMIEFRPDWCISRQRQWGVPIVALLCESCGEAWHDAKWMHDMSDRFAKHATGCDYWYEADINDIIPSDLACPHCQAKKWKKETDILDVWFDSGTSFTAVVEKRKECHFPADLYLEGSDQHRGWFHSSLLASMATRNTPPYKAVLTHGYVVDGSGRKMSKSIGNVIAPQELIDKFGAEIIRLWVSSVEYREDIRISDEILNRLVDAYRRIRNTCRYLLGNISDLTQEQLIPIKDMDPLDRHALDVVARAHIRMQKAYADFEFHKIFHTLHNLCTTDLSANYLDILKDRLYASGATSMERRSAQTALWHILGVVLRNMAPILSFTAEEVHNFIPETLRSPDLQTVFALPSLTEDDLQQGYLLSDEERAKWVNLFALRAAIIKAIEPLRKDGSIGHSLDTKVNLYIGKNLQNTLNELLSDTLEDMRAICIISQLHIEDFATAPTDAILPDDMQEVAIVVEKAQGEKCERCWIYNTNLGTDPNHPSLCPRCTKVMSMENYAL